MVSGEVGSGWRAGWPEASRDPTPVFHIRVRFVSGRLGPCPVPEARGRSGARHMHSRRDELEVKMPFSWPKSRFRLYGALWSEMRTRIGLLMAHQLCTAAGFLAENVHCDP